MIVEDGGMVVVLVVVVTVCMDVRDVGYSVVVLTVAVGSVAMFELLGLLVPLSVWC